MLSFLMPSDDELKFIDSEEAVVFIERSLKVIREPGRKPVDWRKRFNMASEPALDLLKGLLQFCPDKRLTVEEAINHKYFENLRRDDPKLPRCDKTFDWQWEDKLAQSRPHEYPKLIRKMIWQESLTFHPENDDEVPRQHQERKEQESDNELAQQL